MEQYGSELFGDGAGPHPTFRAKGVGSLAKARRHVNSCLETRPTGLADGGRSDMPARRFPPPWTIDDANDACFIVRDSTGQALGYFYFEEEPGRQSTATHQGRGAADGGQLRQAAGTTAAADATKVRH